MRLALSPIAAALALLAGCAHGPEPPPVQLIVEGAGNGCRFEAEGRLLALGEAAETEAALVRAARRWKGRSVTVRGGVDVPYRCFGFAIFVLQRHMPDGLIGFIAEPPPGPE